MKQIVVYCASSDRVPTRYLDVATELGQLLAEKGFVCVNGAGRAGLMGALNNAVLSYGGRAKGIIPRFMVEAGWGHPRLTETIVTETIHERKALMAESADAVVALPGGVGTLEELAEIITWKQLGLFRSPVIILNAYNYYGNLLAFMEKMIEEQFMNKVCRGLWSVASTADEAVRLVDVQPVWSHSGTKYDK